MNSGSAGHLQLLLFSTITQHNVNRVHNHDHIKAVFPRLLPRKVIGSIQIVRNILNNSSKRLHCRTARRLVYITVWKGLSHLAAGLSADAAQAFRNLLFSASWQIFLFAHGSQESRTKLSFVRRVTGVRTWSLEKGCTGPFTTRG